MVTTKEERQAMARILKRYSLCVDSPKSTQSLYMDRMVALEAAHHVCPLDLDRLEQASDADLVQDVAGMIWHLSRDTGELGRGFVPRFAKRDKIGEYRAVDRGTP